MKYDEYLKSDRWSILSSIAKHLAGYRCSVCGGAEIQLETHHRAYRNLGKPAEIDDLTVLCSTCHGIFHNEGAIPKAPEYQESEAESLRRIAANQRRANECLTRF